MRAIVFFFLAGLVLASSCSEKSFRMNLSGNWSFKVDSLDIGIDDQWYGNDFQDTVRLPGSMVTNGKGKVIDADTKWTGSIVDSTWFAAEKYKKYRQPGNIKIPFWLQPDLKYYGAAWYMKDVDIPNDWIGKKIFLNLERCHWKTDVWVNNEKVGSKNSLSTPNVFDMTSELKSGLNKIAIRIDNRILNVNPGPNSHSISDHTQSNWNGIVGDISLEARNQTFIKQVNLFPSLKEKMVKAEITIDNPSNRKEIELMIGVHGKKPFNKHDPGKVTKMVTLEKGVNEVSVNIPMGDDFKKWDEFSPNLYVFNLELKGEDGEDSYTTQFGMREISKKGTRFAVNGRPVFLRGTLECAIFPKTGYPSTEKADWDRIFKIVKSHGLNHVRFHSWCPPKAAFEAADEAGIYLQVESASWANSGSSIGDGAPIDAFIYEETQRIIENYGNHPSFCMMAYGNEPAGANQKEYLTDYIHHFRNPDSRFVFTSAAGWPVIDANDFHNIPGPRIQLWNQGLNSIINREKPQTEFDYKNIINKYEVPVISHEIGQWCVYPDFKEISEYTGPLKAKNFEIFQETLSENGMAHLADSFLLASGKLQALCYKHDIEAALRTPGFGGFQLLDLHDFPGQGTALVGVLNAFWDQKGYITPDEFRHFCDSTVPLVRLPKMVFEKNDTLSAVAEVAHFGKKALTDQEVHWQIEDLNGGVLAEGELGKADIPTGDLSSLGEIHYVFDKVDDPLMLEFKLMVGEKENSWNIWAFPSEKPDMKQDDVFVTRDLNKKAKSLLKQGGKVLLTLEDGTLSDRFGGDIAVGFSSIFWNTAWTKGQAPHTLGVLVDPQHPVFEQFPTQYHSNWQWWDAMTYSNAMLLSEINSEIQPLIRVVDDWNTNRPLGLLFETKVGNGKLMVSGIDFFTDIEARSSGKQLLNSIMDYMRGDSFNPEVSVELEKLEQMQQ